MLVVQSVHIKNGFPQGSIVSLRITEVALLRQLMLVPYVVMSHFRVMQLASPLQVNTTNY